MTEKLQAKFKGQLCRWIDKTCEFQLLYQASRDQVNSTTFHQKCDNKGATVTLFYNTEQSIYGGYTSVNWTSNDCYSYDDKAFLFKLQYNGSKQPKLFPVMKPEQAIYNNGSFGPTFGGHDIVSFRGCLPWRPTDPYEEELIETFRGSSCQPYVHLNGSFNFGRSYDMKGENLKTVANGQLTVIDLEVYAVKEIGKVKSPFLDKPWRVLDKPWRVGQGWTDEFRKYVCKSKSGKYLNFKLCDTRGLEKDQGLHIDDIDALIEGHISEGYTFKPSVAISSEFMTYIASPAAKGKINCLAFVVDSSTVEAMSDTLLERFKTIAKTALKKGLPMVALLTKVDKLCEEVDKDMTTVYITPTVFRAVTTIAEIIGIPRSHVFPVKNYEYEIELSRNVDILLLQALRQSLTFADHFLENQYELSAVASL